MKLVVVSGWREYFLPHRIPAQLLHEGLRIMGSSLPFDLPFPPWVGAKEELNYHDRLFTDDDTERSLSLFVEYLGDMASPTSTNVVFLPFDGLDEGEPHAHLVQLRRHVEDVLGDSVEFSSRRVALSAASLGVLDALSRREVASRADDDAARDGIPSALDRALRRNYTATAVRLATRRVLAGRHCSVSSKATSGIRIRRSH